MVLYSSSIPLFFKLPLLVSDAVCMRISGTPPNPPTSSGRVVVPDWREHFLRSLGYPSKALRAMSWLAQFIEFILIIAYYNHHGPISNLLLKTLVVEDSCIERLQITPLFITGSILNLAGTILRVQCYRTLGRLFTFELRIQKSHQLITDGPYSYIRHPSYTGLILTILGAFCSHASRSWFSQCGPLQNPVIQALAGFWILVALAVILSLLLRVDREDAMLKKAFGDSWTKWSQDVPYRLVPGIY
ncbi:hypothetical protein BT96DRAFT_828253 [Gymnopus androsaceus JB14]|uniref:Protein-S-isoprenylcysteine O-methyltransferase n=1 Tax=Gymnopus androsaceus JB14 TaxID=1447944 RepID=A0A6A4H754_9AGAR|nr:hypothetical protein BT96DRAFT_828253 [Gymnopus androsaceus JB14]